MKNEPFNFARELEHWFDTMSFGISKERSFFVENLSMLVGSGMSMLEALDAISEELDSKHSERIIGQLREEVEAGSPLWRALEKVKVFPSRTISLIRIGEESGRLSENLQVVSEQEQKEREFKSKIRSALMYPVFVLGLTGVIGIGIAWFILPRLSTVFAQLNVELPTITKWLIAAGTFLGEHGNIAVPSFIAVVGVLFYIVFINKRTRFIGHSILFFFGPVRKLIREVEMARFGYLFGTLLGAGLPVVQAAESLTQATDFHFYKKFYTHVRDRLEEGYSFRESFSSYKKSADLISVPMQRLIISGEQSGSLSDTLVSIGERFEKKTDITTKNLTVLLEPVLLVIVWLGVVAVAIAVILPIYSLTGGVQTRGAASAPPIQTQETSDGIVSEIVEEEVVSEEVSGDVGTVDQESLLEASSVIEVAEGLSFLNVRSEPSSSGDIVQEVFSGEQYEYTDQEGEWYLIILNDEEEGWVHGDYVFEVSEEA